MKKFISLIMAVIVICSFVFMALGSGTDTETSSGGTAQAEQEKKAEGEIGDYVCTIKSAEICKDWQGKAAVKITYTFTNNSEDAQSFDVALNDELYQDGIGLESTFISADDNDFGIDVKIKPGSSKDVSKVYILRDKKTVIDVEISEFISLNDEKITYQVELDK